MKCTKCGKLLQSVFAGIAATFKNPVEIRTADGKLEHWLVCNNPNCEDGKFNSNTPKTEDLPF